MTASPLLDPRHFIRLALFGLALSLLGMITYEGLTIFYVPWEALKASISLVTLSYLLIVLKNSSVKVGRVTFVFLFALTQLALLFFMVTIEVIIGSSLMAIWLTRVFYIHRNFIGALADIVFLLLGFFASVWAFSETSSLLLSFWSFFLTQALMVCLPAITARLNIPTNRDTYQESDRSSPEFDSLTTDLTTDPQPNQSRFEDAYRKAQQQLKAVNQSQSITPN